MGQASRKSKAEDLLRNSRRCLARSIREVERESSCLDIEEQRLRAELKKTAEKGDLVRLFLLFSPTLLLELRMFSLYFNTSFYRTQRKFWRKTLLEYGKLKPNYVK